MTTNIPQKHLETRVSRNCKTAQEDPLPGFDGEAGAMAAPASYKHCWRTYEVRCVYEDETFEMPILDSAHGVADALRKYNVYKNPDVEAFVVLALNRKGRLLGMNVASVGIASSALVHPREVLRFAIMQSASAIICSHNHPSGDPAPSAQDIRITRTLREASAAVDIPMTDHIILGHPRFDPLGLGHYSFRAAGSL